MTGERESRARSHRAGSDIGVSRRRFRAREPQRRAYDWLEQLQRLAGNRAVVGFLNRRPARTRDRPLAVQRQSVNQALGSRARLDRGILTFSLPAGVVLKSSSDYEVVTRASTRVELKLYRTGLSLWFSPALKIDAGYLGAADVGWAGLTYDFASATVNRIETINEGALSGRMSASRARTEIEAWFRGLVVGTAAARPRYDPMNDADAPQLLDAIKARLSPGGAPGRPLQDRATGVSAGARVRTSAEIRAQTGSHGVAIPSGCSLDIDVNLMGSLSGALSPARATTLGVTAQPGILILDGDGRAIAQLNDLRVLRGGDVQLLSWDPVGGGPQAAVGGAAAFEMLGSLLSPQGRVAMASGNAEAAFSTTLAIRGAVQREIERALSTALRDLVRSNPDIVPGVDLLSFLGVSA